MTIAMTAPSRLLLAGLALTGALAGTCGTAAAQYYYYEEDYYPRGYYERYAPLPPAPIPRRAPARIAARDYGLAEVDRAMRTGSSYIVDGRSFRGNRERLIFDARSGELVDRIVLQGAPRERTARVDPREDERPAPRLTPRPPERPPVLKPPGQASAPATVVPPAPALPRPTPEPAKPLAAPPVEAIAPPTTVPKPAAAPPAPTPGATNPESGAEKPRLVNPNDIRGGEPERKPPLAKADPSGISVAPVQLPPVQIEDNATANPKPATPEVPVAPLD
jgi:hypothetical protein